LLKLMKLPSGVDYEISNRDKIILLYPIKTYH
jgi:hypothetical protein